MHVQKLWVLAEMSLEFLANGYENVIHLTLVQAQVKSLASRIMGFASLEGNLR